MGGGFMPAWIDEASPPRLPLSGKGGRGRSVQGIRLSVLPRSRDNGHLAGTVDWGVRKPGSRSFRTRSGEFDDAK
jgi:hypothetical protein